MSTRSSADSWIPLVLLVVAVLILAPMFMMVFMGPMGMMGWGWQGDGFTTVSPIWRIGTMLVWLLVLLGAGYFVYRAIANASPNVDDRALEELRMAYARGDLSHEEFQKRRDELERTQ